MIAIFKPIKNSIWFDLRELEISNTDVIVKRYLKINEYKWDLSKLPVYKPFVLFNDNREYLKQFWIDLIDINWITINNKNQESFF